MGGHHYGCCYCSHIKHLYRLLVLVLVAAAKRARKRREKAQILAIATRLAVCYAGCYFAGPVAGGQSRSKNDTLLGLGFLTARYTYQVQPKPQQFYLSPQTLASTWSGRAMPKDSPKPTYQPNTKDFEITPEQVDFAAGMKPDYYYPLHHSILWYFAPNYELALVVTFLLDQFNCFIDRTNDGWFFCTADRMEKKIYMPARSQTRALTKLVDLGIIMTKKQGIPPKRFIKLNMGAVRFIVRQYNEHRTDLKGDK